MQKFRSISPLLFAFLLGCSSDGDAPAPAPGATGSGGQTGSPQNGTDSTGSGGGSSSAPQTGGQTGSPSASDTFRVEGRHLYDRCGEKVILRGVNEMVVWSGGRDGEPEFTEIAKTGANAVRIVWNEEGSAAELDVAIQNALKNQMIPMVEHHGATGDLSLVPSTVDYWTTPDVVAVLKKHEADLLLNIANEAGDADVMSADFAATYKTAIDRLRAEGLVLPLVIDAPRWGQNIDVLQAAGPELIEHDPESNLLFSVHMWWDDATGSQVISEIAESVSMNLPLIVGEFAQHSVWQCADNPFAYQVLLEESQKNEIGWLAWSWGAVDNNDCNGEGEGSFDMTVGGVFGEWEEPWGGEVAVTDPNSIQNTSVIPTSILTGACE